MTSQFNDADKYNFEATYREVLDIPAPIDSSDESLSLTEPFPERYVIVQKVSGDSLDLSALIFWGNRMTQCQLNKHIVTSKTY